MRKISFIKGKLFAATAIAVIALSSCSDDIFDKNPLDKVSDGTFWKTESDANLALTGCYYTFGAQWASNNFWTLRAFVRMDIMAGDGSEKMEAPDHITDGTLYSGNSDIAAYWKQSYDKITRCNNFLQHIDGFTMDESKKAIYKAEVRTLRAYEYFNLALYFGGVPLVTKVLTIEEANSVSRNTRDEVWAFCEKELSESAPVLPNTRPAAELGRMTSGAALAILGRLQMAEKKWKEAEATYKSIMDQGVYEIDPRFDEIFTEKGESSKEIVMRSDFVQDNYLIKELQELYPEAWGGWHQYSPYNELVKDYECTDGKTIDESPLYSEENPYANRDPRLLFTIMVDGISTFKGKTYTSSPNPAAGPKAPDYLGKYSSWTGYCIRKFMDEDFSGNLKNYGADFPLVRYAEVLLGYIESRLEAGETITQDDLDKSINLVRGRACVNMPKVTETDRDKLRTIVRRERHVELAFEGERYYDLLRWGIAADVLNQQFTGMKLTNDPANYTAYPVDDKGYFKAQKRNFKKGVNELWPIPLSETQINPNLTQNPGY
jgi:hypothetical protein